MYEASPCCTQSFTLKTETPISSETSVRIRQIKRCQLAEDCNRCHFFVDKWMVLCSKLLKDIRNLKQHSIGLVVTTDSCTTLSFQLTLPSPLIPPPHPPYRDVCALIRVIISLLPYSEPSSIDLTIHLVLFLATTSSDNGLATLRQLSDF